MVFWDQSGLGQKVILLETMEVSELAFCVFFLLLGDLRAYAARIFASGELFSYTLPPSPAACGV